VLWLPGDPQGRRDRGVVAWGVRRQAKVTDSGGTAYGLAIEGPPFSGKTRTAETEGGKGPNTTCFVACAPTDPPKFAMPVFMEKSGGYGATVAAPIAQHVIAEYFGVKISPLWDPLRMMRVVNAREAKRHLSALLSALEAGEQAVVAKAGKPVTRPSRMETMIERPIGIDDGHGWIAEDFVAFVPREFGDGYVACGVGTIRTRVFGSRYLAKKD